MEGGRLTPVRIVEVLALALVLSSSMAALLAVAPEGSGSVPVTVLVHAPVSEIHAIAPDAEIIEAYDSFALVHTPPETALTFEARGIAVDSQEESHWISLEAVRFDTRVGEPAVSPDLRAVRGDAPALYIVHLIGPVKPTWLTELQGRGVQILQSIPTYAFLVSMDRATRDTVRSLRFVDWVGAYHP